MNTVWSMEFGWIRGEGRSRREREGERERAREEGRPK